MKPTQIIGWTLTEALVAGIATGVGCKVAKKIKGVREEKSSKKKKQTIRDRKVSYFFGPLT